MKKYLTLKNLGWLLITVVTLMIGMSGVSKVIATNEMVQNFEYMKLTPYMGLLGVIELIGIVLLVYPKTSLYGAILISCIMSGAMSIHLSLMGGTGMLLPLLLAGLGWSGHCLRKYY